MWVNAEEESNNFGGLMAEVVSFKKYVVLVEPVEESDAVNSGILDFSEGSAAVEDASD